MCRGWTPLCGRFPSVESQRRRCDIAYEPIKRRLDNGDILILDGATGTELQRRGASMDPAAWCGPATLDHDDLLRDIHADYIRAGADVITANTYASSRLMLDPAGFGDRVAEINTRAVEAALAARDATSTTHRVAVAGSLSHMVPVSAGSAVVDAGRVPSTNEISDALHELAGILRSAGVDHIMLEMMYNPTRAPLALEAALSTGLPVWFGMSARRSATGDVISFDQLEDHPLSTIIDLVPTSCIDSGGIGSGGIDAVGFHHTPAEIISPALAMLAERFDGPLMAYPDSGYFEMPDWQFVDTITPERLEAFFTEWIGQGARILGGCCGLSVEHVEAAVRARTTSNGSTA